MDRDKLKDLVEKYKIEDVKLETLTLVAEFLNVSVEDLYIKNRRVQNEE